MRAMAMTTARNLAEKMVLSIGVFLLYSFVVSVSVVFRHLLGFCARGGGSGAGVSAPSLLPFTSLDGVVGFHL
uniref:Uncharacterized protein n=1 Tax=uncultured prokaryote TaxID=198431 RepID=H5SLF6_9ZZZZ|nr:hypothetical protein HGMM_F46A05C31 [uncultured prokaryote]